jgi:DNA-binding transcriptional LysR family regulator
MVANRRSVQYNFGSSAIPHRYYNGAVEFRHLRYFIAAAERLSFSKAAQQLHIAQPPLSRQIRQLEDEIRAQLFLRTKRGVELTNAGRVFLLEAKRLIAQAEQATEAARQAHAGQAGVIRVGMGSGLGGIVSRVATEHCRWFPAVEVHCKDIFSTPQNEALIKREVDVGFLRPPVDSAHLKSEVLLEEDFVVVLPKAHAMAKRKSVTLRDLINEPLIIFDRHFSSGLHDKILGLYRMHGFTPRLTITQSETHEETGRVMVASGRGIFVGVGAMAAKTLSGLDLATVRLREPGAKIEVFLAWRKDERSALIRAFLDSARTVLRHREAG